jgi:hypothetical protein
MKDVLLLQDNSRPHSSLRTRETDAKIGWTDLPRPAHSPDLAPSYCYLFGPVTKALPGLHLADDKELKQSFRNVLRSRGREFYNIGVQSLIQRWQKRVEMTGTLWKNRHIIEKCAWIIHVNFTVISITFSNKNWRHYFRTAPRTFARSRNPACLSLHFPPP